MIFPLFGLLSGALLGAVQARRRGGGAKDMAQWGAVFGLILGVVGLFVMIVLTRNAL